MFDLIAVTSIWFWIIAVSIMAIVIKEIEDESMFALGFTTVVTALLWFFVVSGSIEIIKWCYNNSLAALGLIAAYFLIGAIWSVVKWYLFLNNIREDYYKFKGEFLRNVGEENYGHNPKIPKKYFDRFKKLMDAEGGVCNYAPYKVRQMYKNDIQIAGYKSIIISWIIWWPVTLVWTLINDPIRKAAEHVYRNLARVYRNIADRMSHAFRMMYPCRGLRIQAAYPRDRKVAFLNSIIRAQDRRLQEAEDND